MSRLTIHSMGRSMRRSMRRSIGRGVARLRNNPIGALILVGLSLSYLYLFPYFPAINNPNENVRVYMTRAIVDHGTMAIGRRTRIAGKNQDGGSVYDELGYVNDKALVCDDQEKEPPNCSGTLYSAKAPGTSFLGVPVYAALKAVHDAKGTSPTKESVLFWLRLFAVILPSIVFLWAFYAFMGRYVEERWIRNAIIVGVGLGSMSYTYAMMFAGHQLAGVALFGSLMCLSVARDRTSRRLPLTAAAGFLLAASVAFEYPTLLMTLPVLAAFLPSRPRIEDLAAFAAGAMPPVIAVSAFHVVAFGAIQRTPYTTLENPGFVQDIAPGFMGLHAPTLEAFWGSFFVPFNGLFFFSPFLILVIGAAVVAVAWRAGRLSPPDHGRREAAVALWVTLAYATFISCHSLWRGGWTLGPRYIAGIVPFAAFAIAVAASRVARRAPATTGVLVNGLAAASVFVTFTCSLVSQGFPFQFFNPLVEAALPLLSDGYVVRNAGNTLGLHGLASAAPLLALAAALTAAALAQAPRGTHPLTRLTRAATAALLATALVVGLTLVERPWDADKARTVQWLKDRWVPPDQAPEVRRQRELSDLARSGDLTSAQREELGSLYAQQGKDRRALLQYRKAVAAPARRPAQVRNQ